MIRWFSLDEAKAQRIKATLGITGWYRLSVHSDGGVRHLDVGSPYPGGGEAPKGMAVRHLKRYASWVQTVQHLNYKVQPCNWGIERFEPRGKCYVRGDVRCDK